MKTKLIDRSTLNNIWKRDWDIDGLLKVVEDAYLAYDRGKVILPEKSSQVFDNTTQSRINCMPATVRSLGLAGVKWVSVFPENPSKYDIPNVGGLMLLSEIETGQTLCVMDAAYLTALRTAAVDALAARLFAPTDAQVLTVIGTGEQARFHAELISLALPKIAEVRITGRTPAHTAALVKDLYASGVSASDYASDMEGACCGSDVVVTAISGQAPVLKANWLGDVGLYCHVGGWEDEYDVPCMSDKIICDSWEALKHRGSPTIARMYSEGRLADSDIYADITDVLAGRQLGREHDELIYFNAIGLGYVDVAVAAWLMEKPDGELATFDFGA